MASSGKAAAEDEVTQAKQRLKTAIEKKRREITELRRHQQKQRWDQVRSFKKEVQSEEQREREREFHYNKSLVNPS